MKTEEASRFLDAFNNGTARELVKLMVLNHYADAVMEHHPDSVCRAEVYGRTQQLVDVIFSRIEHIRDKPEGLDPLLQELSRKNHQPDQIWFEAFNQAYEYYKHHRKLFLKVRRISPYLTGNSYCDVGCGGGDLVNFIRNQFPQFDEYAGIDVLDWRTRELRDSINFQMLDLSQPGSVSQMQYDTLTCIAVLHHVGGTEDGVHTFLQNLRSAVSPQGRLIIEEDVMLPESEIRRNAAYLEQVEERKLAQPLFPEFLALQEPDQKDVMILVDVLANALSGGVTDMAFPFGFRTIEQWTSLFMQYGFYLEDLVIAGFQEGLFNRSSHVYFVLKRKP